MDRVVVPVGAGGSEDAFVDGLLLVGHGNGLMTIPVFETSGGA